MKVLSVTLNADRLIKKLNRKVLMEIFQKRNQNNNEWWGHHKKHGWVVLDRNLYSNKAGKGKNDKLVFMKCTDWTDYEDLVSNWEAPNYIYVIPYLKQFKGEKLRIFDSYIKHKEKISSELMRKQDELRLENLKKLHNQYLEQHGLPLQALVKRKEGYRRVNHCWNCMSPVDNKIDYECAGCGWIVCGRCGACEKPLCGDARKSKRD